MATTQRVVMVGPMAASSPVVDNDALSGEIILALV